MEAILLVGGKGTRLLPLTIDTPKPMLKVAGVPFIAHQIGYAKAHGITRIIVATSYKTEQFLDYLGDGSRFGIEIIHAVEHEPLGTGGAIANAAHLLESSADAPIAVLNGDILSAHDISAQVLAHQRLHSDVTLHLVEVPDARAYGSVPTDSKGRILQFLEKTENPPTNFINAGCYIFTRDVINLIPQEKVVSVERETFPGLLAKGRNLWAYQSNDYWIDIGTPRALLKATTDLVTGKFISPAFLPTTSQTYIDDRAVISESATITPGSAVGAARVGAGATIDASVIGDGVLIEKDVAIKESIIGDGVVIHEGAHISGAFLGGAGVVIKANSRHFQ